MKPQPPAQVSSPFPNGDDDGSQQDDQDDEPPGTDPQDQTHLLRVLGHLQGTLALFAGSCQGTRTGRRGQQTWKPWDSSRGMLIAP